MKAILIVDTPKDCTHCDLCRSIAFEGDMCGATGEPTYSGACPLKPMPERYDEATMREQKGWNRCLDELIGEKE